MKIYALILSFLLCLFSLLFVECIHAQLPPAASISAEEAIKKTVSQMAAAYSKKDYSIWNDAWTPKSPYMEKTRDELKEIVERSGAFKATIVDIEAPVIQADTASITATLSFEEPSGSRFGYQNGKWIFTLKRESDNWKIFRQISLENMLAQEMIRSTPAEKAAVLDRAGNFVPWLIVNSLIFEAETAVPQFSFVEQDRIFALALEFAEKQRDSWGITKSLSRWSLQYRERGNYIAALELEHRRLALFRAQADPSAIADTLSTIGTIHLVKGSPREALPFLEESDALFRRIGSKGANWITLYRIGHAYFQMGDYGRAMEFYEKSVAALKLTNPYDETAVTDVTIANLYATQGNHEQARVLYMKAYATFLKGGSGYGQAICLAGLAEIHQALEQYAQAADFEQKALEIRRLSGNLSQTFFSLKRLGIDYAAMGEPAKAIDYFNEALDLARSRQADNQLSEIYLEIAKLRLAQADGARVSVAVGLARKHAEKLPEQAESWELYAVSGRINRLLGKVEDARSDLDQALKIIETTNIAGGNTEKERFYSGRISAYDELIDLDLAQDRAGEAFSVSERRRSRALIDTLRNGDPGLPRENTPEFKEDKRLREEIASLNSQIAKSLERGGAKDSELSGLKDELEAKRLEYERFRTKLYVSHPELKTSTGEIQPVTLSSTISLLPDTHSILVEYVVSSDKIFVFVITRNASRPQLKVFTVAAKKKDLALKVEAYRAKIADGDLGFADASEDLYKLLLKPVEAQLSGRSNLIIVPDGPLWDLPFQTLQNGKKNFLIQEASVSYAPSLTALIEMRSRAKKNGEGRANEILAFGNPTIEKETSQRAHRVFTDQRLESLPEAERLVKGLAVLYGPTRSSIFTGAKAREEIAKSESSKYRIIQFATHGILNNLSPMYSHLVLARDEKNALEDGLLEAWEMKDLRLRADMVILSACDTARGKISGGEGVVGMTWAMFIAGAPTTVASQWKVESSSTTEFMLEFHRHMLGKQKIAKAEALRRASLKLMKMPQYRHPSYWGAWVLVGDGS